MNLSSEKGSLKEWQPDGRGKVAHFVRTSTVTNNPMHLLVASHPVEIWKEIVEKLFVIL